MKTKTCLLIALVLTLLAGWVSAQDAAFNGKWTLLKHKSSDFDYFREVTIEFAVGPAETVLTTRQGPRRPYEDQLVVRTDGQPQFRPQPNARAIDDGPLIVCQWTRFGRKRHHLLPPKQGTDSRYSG